MFRFPTKAALVAYVAGTAPQTGLHTVDIDESFYNEKIEYVYKNSTLTRLTNPKIEFIKRTNVNTFADVAGITTPVNKNMVVVLKDETASNKVTWYTYNVSQWVLMGEYLGSQLQRAISAADTRGAVIHEDTDFTIPFEYVVGRDELAIYVAGGKLSSTDFIEIGTAGVRSSKVQFKRAILNGTEIEFVRAVHNNQTIDPTFQLNQAKILEDNTVADRTEYLAARGYVYGGYIQDCTKRDYSKVYWCKVNKKYYKPSIKNIVPTMTAASTLSGGKTYVASASSEHGAPFPAWYAFDGNYGTFWHNVDDGSVISATNTEWIKIDMGAATSITDVILVSRDSYLSQIAQDFIIEGSNDNTTFTLLKTVTGANLTNAYSARFDKDITHAEGNYRYYRITISKALSALENSVSLQQVLFLNNVSSTWTTADSDWDEFSDVEGKVIDFLPTLNLLGTVTYGRRMGKAVRTKNGYDITVQLTFTCSNSVQDANFLELIGLPFSIAGGSVASCMTEGFTFPGSFTPATIKAYTHMGVDTARTQSIKFASQNINGRVSQYTTLTRATCVAGAGQMYLFFTMSVVNDKL